MLSKTASSSNDDLRYRRISATLEYKGSKSGGGPKTCGISLTVLASACERAERRWRECSLEPPSKWLSLFHVCEEFLVVLDIARSSSCLLNECRNACLKLKPPGDSLCSSSVRVSVNSTLRLLILCVVNGVTSGWKMSVVKVIVGVETRHFVGN